MDSTATKKAKKLHYFLTFSFLFFSFFFLRKNLTMQSLLAGTHHVEQDGLKLTETYLPSTGINGVHHDTGWDLFFYS